VIERYCELEYSKKNKYMRYANDVGLPASLNDLYFFSDGYATGSSSIFLHCIPMGFPLTVFFFFFFLVATSWLRFFLFEAIVKCLVFFFFFFFFIYLERIDR
jgi:hypothetical protein